MSRISRDIEALVLPDHRESISCDWIGWVPLIALPAAALIVRKQLPPWIFMWALAFALFFGCKSLTWWRSPKFQTPWWQQPGYLLAWPGMDVKAFLGANNQIHQPEPKAWVAACLKTILGAVMIWAIARRIPATQPLLQGWIGLIGLVFFLHFGTFHLRALAWQKAGVNAQPIMRAPVLSQSLAEFWGKRWNAAFNRLVHDFVFRKLFRRVGPTAATLTVFVFSGLIHDLVISLPACGGYGLPTLYFLLQGLGLCAERSKMGRALGLGKGFAGRCFTIAVTAIPVVLLFHPPFIRNVILPMLRVIGAT